ncbi:MAG TPA: hypothetical protein VLT86_04500 [Vicinamibacterales bacterium]|nr:hypothetical protein [Vicinamibacterales bacterium]
MRGVAVVIQILVSLVVAASVMPVLLVAVPATQNQKVGPAVAFGIAALVFALVRIVWPRHKA